MNSNVKKILDLYFDHGVIQKEISNFVKCFEDSETSLDLQPSLAHIELLLKEIDTIKIPSLKQKLDNDVMKNIKEMTKQFEDETEKICSSNINDKN